MWPGENSVYGEEERRARRIKGGESVEMLEGCPIYGVRVEKYRRVGKKGNLFVVPVLLPGW